MVFEVDDVEYKAGHSGTGYRRGGGSTCNRWRISGSAEDRQFRTEVCLSRMGEPDIGSEFRAVVAPKGSAILLTSAIESPDPLQNSYDRLQQNYPPDLLQPSTARSVGALAISIVCAALAVASGAVIIRLFHLGFVSRWGK